VNRSHHANEEIETDAIALLKAGRKYFRPDARHSHLAVWLVCEPVMDVV